MDLNTPPIPPAPFHPRQGGKGGRTATLGLVFEGGKYKGLRAPRQVCVSGPLGHDAVRTPTKRAQRRVPLPNGPMRVHSPLFGDAAKSAVQAPSFAPAGAREGGGCEGGREEASCKAIQQSKHSLALVNIA